VSAILFRRKLRKALNYVDLQKAPIDKIFFFCVAVLLLSRYGYDSFWRSQSCDH
jgi:hypothetical protein